MGIFDRFPYSSTHEMNLDFMLGKATEIAEDMQQVTAGMEQVQAGLSAISEKTEQATQAAAQAAQSASSIEGSVTAAEEAAEEAQMHNESAQTWANNAMNYKADCQRAASEAAASSTSAAQAATAAAASEDTVATYAQAANASAQSAANNNDSAHQYANQASASASNATFHSSNAQTAATNAQTAATNAETAATNANTSATNAAASADRAAFLKTDVETLHRMCTTAVDLAAEQAVAAGNSAGQAAATKTEVENLVESLPEDFTDLNNTVNQLSDEIAELQTKKLDITVYRNETTGTCTAANTFTNFPYQITAGKTYKCFVMDIGNTMSFRTRATADGANIDALGPVVYGYPQTFVATTNAAFIRVTSYLANGSFKIEEVGTIYYEIEALYPATPVINLPEKIYAVSGLELNIYLDNIVENSEKYSYNITCPKGNQMERGFVYTPVDADAGTYTLQIDVLDDVRNVVATASTNLVVSATSAGSGVSKTMILMGDSTVNGTDLQIVNDFNGDSMTVTTIGTMGTAPAMHEGRTGWTFQYYYNSASINNITNPFCNPSTHLFDASYYFSNSGVIVPDWFFIQLGINDVFTITDDDALITKINSMVTQCNAMIASVRSANASIKIGIAVTIPPNKSQNAFGKAYGCGQTRDRYKRNNLLWVKRMLSEYSGMEAQGVYLVPIYTNLDTTYNMGLESVPVNARNTAITYQSPIANGGVHPVESGYQQLADVYKAFLKANA